MMLANIDDKVVYKGLPINMHEYDSLIIFRLKEYFRIGREFMVTSIINIDGKSYYKFDHYAYPYPCELFTPLKLDIKEVTADKYNLR